MISLKYSITEEDYINYYTYVMWDAPEKKQSKLKYYLRQAGINIIVIMVLLYTDIFRHNQLYLYIYIGILIIITLLQVFSARANVGKQAEKIARAKNNRSLFYEMHADINDAGIYIKNDVMEAVYQWPAFVKKQENDAYYFLFTNSIEAIIFPKRIFKTVAEKEQFQRLLSQHLSFDAEVGHLIKE